MAAIVLFVSGSAGVSERDVYPSTRQDGTRLAGSLSPRSETRRCPDHRAGVQFYRQRHALWLKKRGAARPRSGRLPRSCPDARYLAIVWRKRAVRARKAYEYWFRQRLEDPVTAILYVFGRYGQQALRVSSCETGGTFDVYADNGQYLGLFQMGEYARSRYGHSSTALGQARAAYGYFRDSGYDWSPWSCKP